MEVIDLDIHDLLPHDPPAQQRAEGKARRRATPRSSHAGWTPPPGRLDPAAVIALENASRIQALVPIRNARLSASPFAFYRGTASMMAADLATTPSSGILVHACGDAHLLNFGIFATAERRVVFDLNDFDESFPAPFEWDLKRLAASLVLAAREDGFSERDGLTAVRSAIRNYRENMAMYAEMGFLDVWYTHIDIDQAHQILDTPQGQRERQMKRLGGRTNAGSLDKLTETVDGRRRFKENPPIIEHVDYGFLEQTYLDSNREYLESLLPYRRELFRLYRPIDLARRVVGVGSVGLEALVILLQGRDDQDPLFMQLKEARQSVLRPYVDVPDFEHQGRRVVFGQRMLQAATDMLLGWTTGSSGKQYYLRQLRDMKGNVDFRDMSPARLTAYGGLCGWALARAHARSGRASIIAGYIGANDTFDRAIAEFGNDYADQAMADYGLFMEAVKQGKLEVSDQAVVAPKGAAGGATTTGP